MSLSNNTLDVNSPRSSSNAVPRSAANQDPSPSSYITVTSVSTEGIKRNENNLEYVTQSELQSHYGQQQQRQQQQYGHVDAGQIGTTTSLPLHDRSSIVVPVIAQDVDPFVVTVRNSSNKLGKSGSSSFINKNSPGNLGVSVNSKTGPRLALYRSNSSLDLLDRENYYHHQRASLGGKLASYVHPHHQHVQSQQQQHSKNQVKGDTTAYTGCFTRRKDFGSHGSIDVLSNAGGGSGSGSVKSERSSSLGNNHSTGHFLSLVASTMSRDRRGSFDVNESIGSQSTSNTKSGKATSSDVTMRDTTASPRLRLKFQKLWEHKEKLGSSSVQGQNFPGSTQTDGKGNVSTTTKVDAPASIFRKLRGSSTTFRNNGNTKSLPEAVKFDILSPSGDHSVEVDNSFGKSVLLRQGVCMEERYRRRIFAHYDCQSVSANISYASGLRLRGLLSKRRNTTTGASAASLGHRPISTPPPSASLNDIASTHQGTLSLNNSENPSLDHHDDPDLGDGNSNHSILSCPYFRNEIGGEEEKIVCLTRFKNSTKSSALRHNYHHLTSSGSNIGHRGILESSTSSSLGRGSSNRQKIMTQSPWDGAFHRPQQARGLSLLEWSPGSTHWTHGSCPYSKAASRQTTLEAVDLGAEYYQKYFYRQEHENWFGSDEILGPLAISIKRERINEDSSNDSNAKDNSSRYLYRLIVRSTELNTLRGSILEESIPLIKPNKTGGCHAKEVIELLLPEIQLSCLKLGMQTLATEDQLLKLDNQQQILTHRHKVGIMYCRAGQATEEEMYNNEDAGPAFNEFLDLIGQKVRLKGFDKYTGGLCVKDDSTGLYSIYSRYQDCEIIFHVSTLLPFTANNRQQLARKRHIGNDIVTIVFQEPGALPFTPKNIRSQFQHVFIVVRVTNPCTENTSYSVSVSRSKEVSLFGPAIPEGAKFFKNKEFVDFLLAKVINAENATYRSEKFTTMATRTRQEYLKDLVSSYSTNISIDPRPKFSMLPFGNKKKEILRPRFNSDPALGGALSWSVSLDDHSSDSRLDAYIAISNDSLVIIDSISREPVFAIPCSSILGWNTSMCNSLRIYYHAGECVTVHSKEPSNLGENDDLMEIVTRLQVVTMACETREFILRRNDLGQLGFHVQQDGIVTEVEPCGFAAKAGLTQGSRLVEICKVAVSTLNQEQMIDFLKTSNTVVVMVVPALPDGSPRRGCDTKRCPFTLDIEGGEYENLNLNGTTDDEAPSLIHHQFKTPISNSLSHQAPTGSIGQVPGNHRKRYEPRSFSPPRSSNSSGYGTGSSSKSFFSASEPHFPPNSNEGEMMTDDRWYDLTENVDGTKAKTVRVSPPPIPARSANNANGSIIVTQSNGTPVSRQASTMNGNNHYNNNNNNTSNFVGKGSGQSFQNGSPIDHTPVIVVNNLLTPSNSLNSNVNNNNNNQSNNQSNINGSTRNHMNMGTYMTPAAMDKNFITKRDFFQRNNPHHGSFHTKLSPSRSHDLLHLKSAYGLYQGQLKTFPSSNLDGLDDYGALSDLRILNRNHGGLYQAGNPYASPLENTVKGKVTYLTDDFPLTHSHSSEYLVGYDNGGNKDLTALKNERLERLKSTYLDKHRERQYDHGDSDSNKSRYSAPTDIHGESFESSDDDLNVMNSGKKSSNGRSSSNFSVPLNGEVKMRQAGNNSSTPRHSVNRNSTLQEDLIRLIAPDLIPSPTNGPRPSSSSSVPITNGYGNLKARPVSCGGEPTTVSYNSSGVGRNVNLSVMSRNGPNQVPSLQDSPLRRPTAEKGESVTKEESIISTPVPLPLLPDSEHMNWSTLVDTATKAMTCCDMVVEGSSSTSTSTITTPPLKLNKSTNSSLHHTPSVPSVSSSNCSSSHNLLPWVDDLKPDDGSESTLPAVPVESVFNLEARVSQLEAELRKEQQSKQVLAAKVANLQQENRFLHEQSSSTQHQFKKFTEWLRHTVEQTSPTGTKAESNGGTK